MGPFKTGTMQFSLPYKVRCVSDEDLKIFICYGLCQEISESMNFCVHKLLYLSSCLTLAKFSSTKNKT